MEEIGDAEEKDLGQEERSPEEDGVSLRPCHAGIRIGFDLPTEQPPATGDETDERYRQQPAYLAGKLGREEAEGTRGPDTGSEARCFGQVECETKDMNGAQLETEG